jgi:serine/threonine-protein kinase
VLYELLTGVRPYSLNPESATGLEAQILGTQPRPPSQIAAEKEFQKALRGDLDRVILKALSKHPKSRYASVEDFAEDVRRYLQRRPVLAHPARPWYTATMFVRRRWLAVLAGTILLSILVATSALTTWQAQVALARARQAEEARTLMISMLFDAHAYWGSGKQMSALDLLRQTQQRLMALPTWDIRSRVQVLNILGASLLSQQDTNHAEATASRAMAEAVELKPSDPERLRSRLMKSWVAISRGQTDRVHGEIDRLLADMNRYGSAFPEDLASAWRVRSAAAFEEGDGAEAISSALESLRIAESRLGTHHNQSVLALVDLCSAYERAGRLELALKTGEMAVTRALETYSKSATHPNVLKARMALSQAVAGSGHADRGIRLMQDAIDDAVVLFGPQSRFVGVGLKMIAEMQVRAGRWREAKQSIDRAYSILSDHLRRDSPGFASLLTLHSEIERENAALDARK